MSKNNATNWLESRFAKTQGANTQNQGLLQGLADNAKNQIANAQTQRVFKKMIWRVGKLLWQASEIKNGHPVTLPHWKKTSRRTSSEELLSMNCWEAVLYMAYQCDIMTVGKIQNFENSVGGQDQKIRSLFGDAAAYNGHNANIGDILSFENQAKGEIDHIAIYAGNLNGFDYLIHNLAWNAHVTGILMGGCIHFETVQNTIDLYQGENTTANVFVTQPFWEAGSPTFNYFSQL